MEVPGSKSYAVRDCSSEPRSPSPSLRIGGRLPPTALDSSGPSPSLRIGGRLPPTALDSSTSSSLMPVRSLDAKDVALNEQLDAPEPEDGPRSIHSFEAALRTALSEGGRVQVSQEDVLLSVSPVGVFLAATVNDFRWVV